MLKARGLLKRFLNLPMEMTCVKLGFPKTVNMGECDYQEIIHSTNQAVLFPIAGMPY
jgi:hypothetical protein